MRPQYPRIAIRLSRKLNSSRMWRAARRLLCAFMFSMEANMIEMRMHKKLISTHQLVRYAMSELRGNRTREKIKLMLGRQMAAILTTYAEFVSSDEKLIKLPPSLSS